MLPPHNDHRTSSIRAKNSVWSSGISMESATEQGLRTQQLVTLPDSLLRGFSLQNGELTHSKSFAPSADSKAFVTDLLLVLCSLQRSLAHRPARASPGHSHPGALCLWPIPSLAWTLRLALPPAPGLLVLLSLCRAANLGTPRTLPGMENRAAEAGNNQEVPQLPREPAIQLLESTQERTKNIYSYKNLYKNFHKIIFQKEKKTTQCPNN